MFFKVPHFLARTKTTTLCEGDVQAALVEFLQAISRNTSASVSNSANGGDGFANSNGILQFDEINLRFIVNDYAVTLRARQLEYYVIKFNKCNYKCRQRNKQDPSTRAPSVASSSEFNLDLSSISEGDVALFDQASFRNLRQSSLLVTSKIYWQMELQNKNDKGLPIPSLPIKPMSITLISDGDMPIAIASEGDFMCRTELSVMTNVKACHYVSLVEFPKNVPQSENGHGYYKCKQTEQDSLLPLTSFVSEGDLLLHSAAISYRLISSTLLVTMHESGHNHRCNNSLGLCSYCANKDNKDLTLAKCIPRDMKVIFDSKDSQTRQFESITNELFHKQIESTVMVDTTMSFLMHRSSAATHQSTIFSFAYLLNHSNRQAASIDVSTQQNSLRGFDGSIVNMVQQLQVLVLALLVMYAFACTFATTRYFLSTSFVILHRSLKQHVNKKIFYRSHTRFKACSYSRESRRIFSPQQSNHSSLNLHFTRESENISIRSISNIYSDQFRIYLKFRYKVFI